MRSAVEKTTPKHPKPNDEKGKQGMVVSGKSYKQYSQ